MSAEAEAFQSCLTEIQRVIAAGVDLNSFSTQLITHNFLTFESAGDILHTDKGPGSKASALLRAVNGQLLGPDSAEQFQTFVDIIGGIGPLEGTADRLENKRREILQRRSTGQRSGHGNRGIHRDRRSEEPTVRQRPQPHATKKYKELSEKNVMVELKDVNKVYQLGLQLGLSAGVVDRLERDHQLVEDRKQAMVIHWLKNDASASWNKLSDALSIIEHEVVAKRVRQYTSDPAFKEDMCDGSTSGVQPSTYTRLSSDGVFHNDSSKINSGVAVCGNERCGHCCQYVSMTLLVLLVAVGLFGISSFLLKPPPLSPAPEVSANIDSNNKPPDKALRDTDKKVTSTPQPLPEHTPTRTMENKPEEPSSQKDYFIRCRKIKNVLEVKKELKDIVNDWMVLGEELGVSSSKLKKIEADRRGDVERMTSEMITAWFNGSANAGWEQLVKALKEIGRDRIAHDIIERKC